MAEYDTDKLADDSDDEKKIEKAEKAAERKAAMTARKKRSRSAQQQQPGNFVGHETHLLQNPQTGRQMATDCVSWSPSAPSFRRGRLFLLWGVRSL